MTRTRNFATIVYAESAPENWIDILKEQHIPAFVSPLHNNDFNSDGELKKEHYHVMILFDSVKTIEQAKEIFDLIGGVGVEIVKSTRAYARYLCHLDDADKAQYEISNVISCSGADYQMAIGLPSDKYIMIGEIIEFCIKNNVYSYAQLLIYARDNRYDWFRVLCDSGAVAVINFLKSLYWEVHKT